MIGEEQKANRKSLQALQSKLTDVKFMEKQQDIANKIFAMYLETIDKQLAVRPKSPPYKSEYIQDNMVKIVKFNQSKTIKGSKTAR